MKYQNRQPAEGINVSKHSPVKLFLQLIAATAVLAVMVVFGLQLSGSWLAKKIPFRFEQAVMEKIDFEFSADENDNDDNDAEAQISQYLNELALRLGDYLPNPDKVSYTVHYNSDDTFNAFATVGGNVVFYKGLLSKMPNENALAMVMAHEMAHVSHRDPVSGLGGGVASMIALSTLFGNSGVGPAGSFINSAGGLTSVQFTRTMENKADDAAILALGEMYGHTQDADTLFKMIALERKESAAPDWLARFTSTHPLDDDRVENIGRKALQLGLPEKGEVTPLPAFWAEAFPLQ